jgi:hypothetical protein
VKEKNKLQAKMSKNANIYTHTHTHTHTAKPWSSAVKDGFSQSLE